MIRLAKLPEITQIVSITKACATFMQSQGIYQWNEHYPSEAAFLRDVDRQELYVLLETERIIGAVVVSTQMDTEYLPIRWLTPSINNYYIHRLCVHPDVQGRGHARRLMDFAENMAKTNKAASVRLDTFSQNKRNQRFYETRGYQKLGDIYFPKQSQDPFHCYELVL
ncbi:Putative acetyltransferase [Croceitalea dokdonensis DOKDO 023]|uniref:Putative acetyltransferase n=1 Tax=Croceitalea dokdonensis DOKDO 023 TaxID=1300341 RepID=A0A0P7AS86_9FLAO|nr:GNAT family N-acetyltransferase [Croceitalea dokdonensis]KPM30809.1 Putative acetyltransferase [Croceitalea dokdonensis DOKDO 023]